MLAGGPVTGGVSLRRRDFCPLYPNPDKHISDRGRSNCSDLVGRIGRELFDICQPARQQRRFDLNLRPSDPWIPSCLNSYRPEWPEDLVSTRGGDDLVTPPGHSSGAGIQSPFHPRTRLWQRGNVRCSRAEPPSPLRHHHENYSIDIQSYGNRGRWTCLRRRLSRAEPLEKRWTFEVANANFRKDRVRNH